VSPISAATPVELLLMLAQKTFAPSSADRCAIALPIPGPAPVMTATLFFRCMHTLQSFSCCRTP